MTTTPTAIDIPFRVDGAGGIASTTNRARQIANRLAVVIGTNHRERVMRARYGANVQSALFAPGGSAVAVSIETDIRETLKRFESDIAVQSVHLVPGSTDQMERGILQLEVTFVVPTLQTTTRYVAVISTGGQVSEVVEQI